LVEARFKVSGWIAFARPLLKRSRHSLPVDCVAEIRVSGNMERDGTIASVGRDDKQVPSSHPIPQPSIHDQQQSDLVPQVAPHMDCE
jgi:hypothetical protein